MKKTIDINFIPEDGNYLKRWDLYEPLFDNFYILGPEVFNEKCQPTCLYQYPFRFKKIKSKNISNNQDDSENNVNRQSPATEKTQIIIETDGDRLIQFLFPDGVHFIENDQSFRSTDWSIADTFSKRPKVYDHIIFIKSDGSIPHYYFCLRFRCSPYSRPAVFCLNEIEELMNKLNKFDNDQNVLNEEVKKIYFEKMKKYFINDFIVHQTADICPTCLFAFCFETQHPFHDLYFKLIKDIVYVESSERAMARNLHTLLNISPNQSPMKFPSDGPKRKNSNDDFIILDKIESDFFSDSSNIITVKDLNVSDESGSFSERRSSNLCSYDESDNSNQNNSSSIIINNSNNINNQNNGSDYANNNNKNNQNNKVEQNNDNNSINNNHNNKQSSNENNNNNEDNNNNNECSNRNNENNNNNNNREDNNNENNINNSNNEYNNNNNENNINNSNNEYNNNEKNINNSNNEYNNNEKNINNSNNEYNNNENNINNSNNEYNNNEKNINNSNKNNNNSNNEYNNNENNNSNNNNNDENNNEYNSNNIDDDDNNDSLSIQNHEDDNIESSINEIAIDQGSNIEYDSDFSLSGSLNQSSGRASSLWGSSNSFTDYLRNVEKSESSYANEDDVNFSWPENAFNARENFLHILYDEIVLPAIGEEIAIIVNRSIKTRLTWRRPTIEQYCMSLSTYGIEPLLEWMNLNDFVRLLSLVFLECNIIVSGTVVEKIMRVVSSIPHIIFPFAWMFTIMTIIPDSILDLLGSPVPFIAGVFKKERCVSKIIQLADAENILIIDMDDKHITWPKKMYPKIACFENYFNSLKKFCSQNQNPIKTQEKNFEQSNVIFIHNDDSSPSQNKNKNFFKFIKNPLKSSKKKSTSFYFNLDKISEIVNCVFKINHDVFTSKIKPAIVTRIKKDDIEEHGSKAISSMMIEELYMQQFTDQENDIPFIEVFMNTQMFRTYRELACRLKTDEIGDAMHINPMALDISSLMKHENASIMSGFDVNSQ